MYNYGWFALLYSRNQQHYKAVFLQLKNKLKKKKRSEMKFFSATPTPHLFFFTERKDFLPQQQTRCSILAPCSPKKCISVSLFQHKFTQLLKRAYLNHLRAIWSTSAAAAAKSLQLCLTLCDPIDGSPPGSPVPGILQARTLEWVAIAFSNAWKWKVKVKSLSHVWLFATPWTAACQDPPSIGFSRQEYGSGLPLPSSQPWKLQTEIKKVSWDRCCAMPTDYWEAAGEKLSHLH